MDELDGILAEAAAAVAHRYFFLPVDGTEPVYRERVYCYELYHQMRTRWPKNCPYSLNGEVDKRNHPYLGEGARKPDFLVHVPGTGDNDAAIEVKGPGATAVGIRKDIGTLLTFRQWYGRVIYLVYGVDPHAALERVTASAKQEEHLDMLELWVHPAAGQPAVRITQAV